MNKPKKLRKLLAKPGAILLPVAHDALTAKIIEKVGFEAFSIGGLGIAASTYGLPDVGFLTQTEMVNQAKNILRANTLPALVDADTGYGNHLNVTRTINLLEEAGAAAIFIEDQVFPKRCGHTNVKEIIPAKEMGEKIKAAVSAKKNKDLLIMARTDARSAQGSIESAIKRAKAYLAAGAEAIFVEAPRTVEEVEKVAKELKGTILLINMMEGGKTPLLPKSTLEKMGYKMIAYPLSSILTTIKAVTATLTHLKTYGSTNDYFQTQMTSFEEFKDLIGFNQYL